MFTVDGRKEKEKNMKKTKRERMNHKKSGRKKETI
jgi:hypothetical protein